MLRMVWGHKCLARRPQNALRVKTRKVFGVQEGVLLWHRPLHRWALFSALSRPETGLARLISRRRHFTARVRQQSDRHELRSAAEFRPYFAGRTTLILPSKGHGPVTPSIASSHPIFTSAPFSPRRAFCSALASRSTLPRLRPGPDLPRLRRL